MDQRANVRPVYWAIHSRAVFALPINARRFIHARMVKCVSAAGVSTVVRVLCVALAPPVNQQRENVYANHISLEILTIFACHVSSSSIMKTFGNYKKKTNNFSNLFLQLSTIHRVNLDAVKMLIAATASYRTSAFVIPDRLEIRTRYAVLKRKIRARKRNAVPVPSVVKSMDASNASVPSVSVAIHSLVAATSTNASRILVERVPSASTHQAATPANALQAISGKINIFNSKIHFVLTNLIII